MKQRIIEEANEEARAKIDQAQKEIEAEKTASSRRYETRNCGCCY